ncbi:MAG TPA: matrixin family metalloprotease [Jatrophihabitans sp.]|uniref:matrixin family metalloprotease n=1 Tax=Jatrophihabitans sp. TaxID=1932789 RepID=UPI002DFCA90B|nr:matrixin family metalloprotease [Jatrophihabitans sp.]
MGRRLDALTFGPARRGHRMRKRLAELDRADARLRAAGIDPIDEWLRQQDPRMNTGPTRPIKESSGAGRIVLLLLVLLVVGYVAVHHFQAAPGTAAATGFARPDNLPPVSSEEQPQPLGTPLPAPAGDGGYAFEATQPGSSAPAAWDPCRPIHYVTNGAAPAGEEGVVASVLAELTRITGFRFVDDGPTTEVPQATNRAEYQPALYGTRWAPVLVAWTDPTHVPRLTGPVIGLGGADSITFAGSPRTLVSGLVYFDAPQFRANLADPRGRARQRAEMRAVVRHEFGHLLGLAHVGDPRAIMYPETHLNVTDYSPADLRGLHALSVGPCAPTL